MHLLFFLAESLKNDCLEVLKKKKDVFNGNLGLWRALIDIL